MIALRVQRRAAAVLALSGIASAVSEFVASSWTGSGPTVGFVAQVLLFSAVLVLCSPIMSPRVSGFGDYVLSLAILGLPFYSLEIAKSLKTEVWCVTCLVSATIVLLLFVISLPAPRDGTAAIDRLRRDLAVYSSARFGLAFVLLVVGVAITVTAASWAHLPLWLSRQASYPALIPTSREQVEIVVFMDFECPFCRARHEEYARVLSRLAHAYPQRVKLTRRDFPLETECNKVVKGDLHPAACEAAVAAAVAENAGKADEVVRLLYQSQNTLSGTTITDLMATLGLDDDYERSYEATLTRIDNDVTLAAQLGVRGTPAYFVNSVKIPPLSAAAFETLLTHLLRRE